MRKELHEKQSGDKSNHDAEKELEQRDPGVKRLDLSPHLRNARLLILLSRCDVRLEHLQLLLHRRILLLQILQQFLALVVRERQRSTPPSMR